MSVLLSACAVEGGASFLHYRRAVDSISPLPIEQRFAGLFTRAQTKAVISPRAAHCRRS
jgi:hypothetical protein